jgi:hypothetical protein
VLSHDKGYQGAASKQRDVTGEGRQRAETAMMRMNSLGIFSILIISSPFQSKYETMADTFCVGKENIWTRPNRPEMQVICAAETTDVERN